LPTRLLISCDPMEHVAELEQLPRFPLISGISYKRFHRRGLHQPRDLSQHPIGRMPVEMKRYKFHQKTNNRTHEELLIKLLGPPAG
jgi:hypothetical protein